MKLLNIFGVDLRLNLLFLVLFVLYWYLGVLAQAVIVFCSVFLHEIGHVLVAMGYGIKIKEIELLPFGGVAKVEGDIEINPVIETYVALAGPLTNCFLACAGHMLNISGMGNQQWLPFFISCNLLLGLFNLLPAIPLDGGRVFRAFISLRLGVKRATDKAVTLSVLLSCIVIIFGVLVFTDDRGKGLNCVVIAVFLVYSAMKEKGAGMYIFMKFLTRKKEELFKEGVLPGRQLVALESSRLRDVVRYFVPRKYHLVVVMGRDQAIRGTLTEGEVIAGLLGNSPELPVGNLVRGEK
jgi:stage IV sporulation protein FB